MSTETMAPETTPETPAKVLPSPESLNPLASVLLERAQEVYGTLKGVAEKQAKVGDVGKLLSEGIESSTDPEVIKRRQAVEKANAAIIKFTKEMEEMVKPTLSIPTEQELADMDTEYKTLSSQLNTFAQVFNTEVQKDHPELTLFDYTGEIPGKRRGAKAGQGQGTSRPRLSSVEYTHDKNGAEGWKKAEKDGKSSFSHLVLAIKSETGESISAGDLHEAWTSQNGKSDWTDLPEVSTFAYSVTDKEGKTHDYMVRATK